MTTTKVNGPPRKPTALKQLAGNPGRRPLPKGEPKPTGKIGNPPKHMTTGAKKVWKNIVEAVPPGLLTNLDREQFELYCELRAWIRDHMDPPPIKEIVQLRQLAASFGLDPASRTRIDTGQPGKERDPFAELLNATKIN